MRSGVIGDAVNSDARLEQLDKGLETDILISENPPVNELIENLAKAVEDQYQAAGRKRSRFPDVASKCLEEAGLHEKLRLADVLAWVGRADIGRQFDLADAFGDPPLTLWHNKEFRIEVYLWLETQTTIHDHRFSGAFQVLEGRTLHSSFAWETAETVAERLAVGEMTRTHTELLQCGGVRPIYGGPEMIHQALHLSTPTLTLIVRTHLEYDLLYQWRYWRPGLATVTSDVDDLLAKRLAVLRFLARGGPEHVADYMADLLKSGDPYHLFHAIQEHWTLFRDTERREEHLEAVRRTHGAWANHLKAVFEEPELKGTVRWDSIEGEGPRFMAGILTTCPEPALVERLVGEFAPGRPANEATAGWMKALAETGGFDFARSL
jgi:hypothetical protein